MNPVANMRPNTKGPKAAMAAVHPMTPPAWRGWKIIGICLNVDALPTPVKKKIASIPQKNFGKPSAEVGESWNDVNAMERGDAQRGHQRDPATSDPVGDRASRHAGGRPDEGPAEGVLRRVDSGLAERRGAVELLHQEAEGGRQPGEGSEGDDVEQRS